MIQGSIMECNGNVRIWQLDRVNEQYTLSVNCTVIG